MVEAKTADTFFPERVQGTLAGVAADLTSLGAMRQPELGLGAGHQVGADKPEKEAPASWVARTQAATVAESMKEFLNKANSPSQSHADQITRGNSPKKSGPGLG